MPHPSRPSGRAGSTAAGFGWRRIAQSSLAFLLLSIAPFFARPQGLGAQDARAFARKIDRRYNHLATLKAHFSEHYRGMGMDRTESGTLLMKKPGRMRWSYNDPSGKVFVLDGKFAYSFTPGDSHAERAPASQLDDMRSPLRLLLGRAQLDKELAELSLTPAPQGFRLTGSPKDPQAGIHSLAIQATADGVIQAIRIDQADGATTEFAFSGVEENPSVGDGEFRFNPPSGIDVVDAASAK